MEAARGGELVADLVVTGLEDPWLIARVEPGPALEAWWRRVGQTPHAPADPGLVEGRLFERRD